MPRDHRRLAVWELAAELRMATLRLTQGRAFVGDRRLRSEIEDTVSSICRNIPEGARRQSDREFARFLEYSYGASGELGSLFEDAEIRTLLTRRDLAAARQLRYRLDRALLGLIRYLRSSSD